MSRIMRKTEMANVPAGTAANILTVPAGHKYEILMAVGYGVSNGAGFNVASYIVDSTPLAFVWLDTFAAGLFAFHQVYGPLCLETGDIFGVAMANMTSDGRVAVTYMDVDF